MRAFLLTAAAASLLLVGCGSEAQTTNATAAPDMAELPVDTSEQLEEETMTTFTAQQGIIQAINKTEDGTFVELTHNDEPLTFFMSSDTIVVNDQGDDITLEVGMNVSGFMYTNSAMVLIYPPRYSPLLVIAATDDAGQYNVSAFNDELVNEDHTLRLQADVAAGNYAVFYTMSTRSIPAMTTPHRIISLPTQ